MYDDIEVNDVPIRTLFDSGSRRSYITRPAVARAGLDIRTLASPFHVGLGGQRHALGEYCNVEGKLGGFDINFLTFLVDSLGTDEQGRSLDALFGATDMQLWSIGLGHRKTRP